MAHPLNRDQVFKLIEYEENKIGGCESGPEGSTLVQNMIQRYAHLPFMVNVKAGDYYRWTVQDIRAEQAEEARLGDLASNIKREEYLDAAYDFMSSSSNATVRGSKLVTITATERVPPVCVGQVYGNTTLWLIPAPAPLQPSEIDVANFTSFSVPDSNAAAVYYADSHPSEVFEKRASTFDLVPDEDRVLRRFWPLGYLAERPEEFHYVYTGHVMVMDMGRNRKNHPWIILASEWPDVNGDGDTGTGWFEAPRRVRLDAPDVQGIFPGDTRRTPIAKIIPVRAAKPSTVPFLKQLGPHLSFDLYRREGERTFVKNKDYRTYHPDLVRIMSWFWDEKARQEVCYAKNGKECMRYDPSTGDYPSVNLRDISEDGSIGLFGQMISDFTAKSTQPTSGPITLASRGVARQEFHTAGYGSTQDSSAA